MARNYIPVGILVPNKRIQAEALSLAGSGELFKRKEPMGEGLLQPVRPTRKEPPIALWIKEELAKEEAPEKTPKPIPLNILFSLTDEELDLAI